MVREVEWRTIPGCSAYQASTDGRVRRVVRGCPGHSRRVPHEIKAPIDHSGYRYVNIQTDPGPPRRFTVHRLVAICFIPNPDEHPLVLHGDNDKLNNVVENLRWGTQVMNLADQLIHGTRRRGEAIASSRLLACQVREIIRRKAEGESAKALASEFGVTDFHVYRLARRERWRHVQTA